MGRAARSAKAQARPRAKDLQAWVERAAGFFFNVYGLPPITGRILSWLMVCDPPEQSAAGIAKAIGASRASLTTNMRLLTASGLVNRRMRPGERTAYYRVDDDAWEQVLRRRFASIAAFREITKEGLAMLGPETPRARRVRAAHDMFEWAARVAATLPPPSSRKRRG